MVSDRSLRPEEVCAILLTCYNKFVLCCRTGVPFFLDEKRNQKTLMRILLTHEDEE